MGEARRKFDKDFREGAVRLVRETGKPIAQVARDLGINVPLFGIIAMSYKEYIEMGGKAVEGTEFACMQEGLVGPLILAFSLEDPGAAARVISAFAKEKENDKLVAKGEVVICDGNYAVKITEVRSKEERIRSLT